MMRTFSALLVALAMLLVVAPGCKKSDSAEGGASGSSGSSAAAATGGIVGSWNLDTDAMLAAMPEEERAMAGAFMGMMQMTMTFGADNTVAMRISMMGQEETESGTYETVSTEGTTTVIRMTSADGQVANLSIDASTAGQLRITDLDEPEEVLIFSRAE